MRLLDVESMRVVDVRDDARPRYSILSHTWGADEVSLQDLELLSKSTHGRGRSDSNLEQQRTSIQERSGYLKITQAAAMARQIGDDYIWIDTCCIDKTSSAELSEAINSMFRWYQESNICFGFLSDVKPLSADNPHDEGSTFRKSRWFSRGWTLQELIASPRMAFYAEDWSVIGTKKDADFCRLLSDITGVDQRVMSGVLSPLDISVANRMKWAAHRQTTRLEDMAYCLMGIFHVNMPLLYGEGSRAFIRLQEEILKETDDQSLFAWNAYQDGGHAEDEDLHGLLATSPAQFADVGVIRPLPPLLTQESVPSSITNQGLRVHLYLVKTVNDPARRSFTEQEYTAVLDCSEGTDVFPAIYLRKLYGDQYARVHVTTRYCVTEPTGQHASPEDGYKTIYVRQNPRYVLPEFTIRGKGRPDEVPAGDLYTVKDVHPPEHWDPHSLVLSSKEAQGVEALAIIRFTSDSIFHTEVDVAVGLSRLQGRWHGWCYQVPTEGSSIADAYHKFNDNLVYLARSDVNSDRMGTTAKIQEVSIHGRSYMLLEVLGKAEIAGAAFDGYGDDEAIPSNLAKDIEKGLEDDMDRLLARCSVQDSDRISLWPDEVTHQVRVGSPQTAQEHVVSALETALKQAKISDVECASIWKLCMWTEATTDLAWNSFSALLRNGRDVLSKPCEEFHGFTAFHFAIAFGNDLVMERLLGEINNSDDPSDTIIKPTDDGWTPAHLVAILSTPGQNRIFKRIINQLELRFSDESVESLLGSPTRVMLDTPLHLAAAYTRPEAVAAFLDSLVDHDEENDISTGHRNFRVRNTLDEIPLHRACAMGNLIAVKRLMKFAPDSIIEVDRFGRSPLWHATVGNHAPIIRLLVSRNVLIDLADDEGRTPLHAACRDGRVTAVETLLELEANKDAETADPGLTPAHYAALFGHVAILELLIAAGANVKHTTSNTQYVSFEPMHLAAANGHVECVKVLLKAGCDPFRKCSHYVVAGKDDGKEVTALIPARGATAEEIARTRRYQGVLEAMTAAKELEYDWGTGMLKRGRGTDAE